MNADLRTRTLELIEEVRATLSASALPVAVNDARCRECQLLGHCLPGVSAQPETVARYVDREVFGCGS